VIPAGPRRVKKLAAPERRPAIHPDQDAAGCLAPSEQAVGQFGEIQAEGGAVAPHIQLAGEALDHVDARVTTPGGISIAGREIHPEGALVRVPEGVSLQGLALELDFLETPGKLN
jgi:hypothetical protein